MIDILLILAGIATLGVVVAISNSRCDAAVNPYKRPPEPAKEKRREPS